MPVTVDDVIAALRPVEDPELHRSIVDLDMVRDVRIDGDRRGAGGHPHRRRLPAPQRDPVPGHRTRSRGIGVSDVDLSFGVMTDEQRAALREQLHGDPSATAGSQAAHGHAEGRAIPFADPESTTRVLLIASGKGGVGKSSVTTNLSVALAQRGKDVAVIDADVWGFSIPRMLGVAAPAGGDRLDARPAHRGRRRALHLDGVLRQGGPAGHLAGSDAPQGARAVPHRRLLGRPRLPPRRPPAGHRRHLPVPRAVPAAGRGLRRHHPAARRPEGGAARRVHGAEGEPRGEGRHREHELVHRRRRQALRALRRRRRRRAGRGARRAHARARCPLVAELREGSDAGRPIVLTDPDGEAAQAFAAIAEQVEVDLAPTRRYRKELRSDL